MIPQFNPGDLVTIKQSDGTEALRGANAVVLETIPPGEAAGLDDQWYYELELRPAVTINYHYGRHHFTHVGRAQSELE